MNDMIHIKNNFICLKQLPNGLYETEKKIVRKEEIPVDIYFVIVTTRNSKPPKLNNYILVTKIQDTFYYVNSKLSTNYSFYHYYCEYPYEDDNIQRVYKDTDVNDYTFYDLKDYKSHYDIDEVQMPCIVYNNPFNQENEELFKFFKVTKLWHIEQYCGKNCWFVLEKK